MKRAIAGVSVVLMLAGCRTRASGEARPPTEASTSPLAPTSSLAPGPERVCTPVEQLRPAAREPMPLPPRPYPPTYAASSTEPLAFANEFANNVEPSTITLARHGDLIDELHTRATTMGAGSTCGFNQDEIERWADLLADHAERFGIDRPFELAPTPEGTLHARDPELALAITIEILGDEVRVAGHWWPGLRAPEQTLRLADVRAQAKRWRAYRVVKEPQPVHCRPHTPCIQQVLEKVVRSRALKAEDIASLRASWRGVEIEGRLEFRLITTIMTHKLGELQIEGVEGVAQAGPSEVGPMGILIEFIDGGRSIVDEPTSPAVDP